MPHEPHYTFKKFGPFELDNRVSAGHLVSILLLILAGVSAFYSLDTRVVILEATRPTVVDSIIDVTEDVSDVRRDINDMKVSLIKIQTILEEKEKNEGKEQDK